MTFHKINYQPERLMFAFRSKEREFIHTLTNRANYLLDLILHKKSTQEERNEYFALKWMLKELCAIDNDNLEKVINNGNNEKSLGDD